MSVDFLPNRAGPEQRAQAANAAAVRQRLFGAPIQLAALELPAPKPVPPLVAEAEQEDVPDDRRLSIKGIIAAACTKHKVPVRELCTPTRQRRVVRCRQELCHTLRNSITVKGAPISLLKIAMLVGVHHTTVMHSINEHAKRIAGEAA